MAGREIGVERIAGVVALMSAVLLMFVSISSTPDTPCGPITSPNFGWAMTSQCGLVHVGTAATCAFLLCLGTGLLVAQGRTQSRILEAATGITIAVAIIVSLRAITYNGPVVGRGWDALRMLVGAVAAGCTGLLILVRASRFRAIGARSSG